MKSGNGNASSLGEPTGAFFVPASTAEKGDRGTAPVP